MDRQTLIHRTIRATAESPVKIVLLMWTWQKKTNFCSGCYFELILFTKCFYWQSFTYKYCLCYSNHKPKKNWIQYYARHTSENSSEYVCNFVKQTISICKQQLYIIIKLFENIVMMKLIHFCYAYLKKAKSYILVCWALNPFFNCN